MLRQIPEHATGVGQQIIQASLLWSLSLSRRLGSVYRFRFGARRPKANPQPAASAIPTPNITRYSRVDGIALTAEADTLDAGSAGPIPVVDGGIASVEEGAAAAVVDVGSVTVVDAEALVVVSGRAVVVVSGRAVVVVAAAVRALAWVVVVVGFGLAFVVVTFLAVVVVTLLTVVVVADLWHPGKPWPAGGLQVLPGCAVTGPAYTHAASPIAVANANVTLNAMSFEPIGLLDI